MRRQTNQAIERQVAQATGEAVDRLADEVREMVESSLPKALAENDRVTIVVQNLNVTVVTGDVTAESVHGAATVRLGAPS